MILFDYLILLLLLVVLFFMFKINASLNMIAKQNDESIQQNNESLTLMKSSIKDAKEQYKKNDDIRNLSTLKLMLYDEIENLKYTEEKIDNVIVYTNNIIDKYNALMEKENIELPYNFNYDKYKIINLVNKYNIKEYTSNLKIDNNEDKSE